MKNALLVVTLAIGVFVLWLQLTLCVVVFQMAENMYEITDVLNKKKCK